MRSVTVPIPSADLLRVMVFWFVMLGGYAWASLGVAACFRYAWSAWRGARWVVPRWVMLAGLLWLPASALVTVLT